MKLNCLTALVIFTLVVLTTKVTVAQNYVEIGSGTIQNAMPIYSSWNYSWSSLIYNHNDLGTAKTITKIGLNCINGPKTVTNQKMYIKLVSNDVYPNTNYEDPLNTGYTLVFQGNLTFQNGWNEIVLTTPISYDGVQNLSIHWENRWGSTYGPQFNSSASTINNNKNCGNDVSFPPSSQTGYLNPYPSSLTNMRFYYTSSGPGTPANPSPTDNATVVSVDTDLSWTIGVNTTSYDLYFGTDPLNLPVVVSDAPCSAGIYSYTIPGLLADSAMHYWKVVAKNGSQQEISPIWKFKTEVVIDQFPYNEGFEDSLVFHTYPVVSAWIIAPDISWYEYNVNPHSGLLCAKSSFFTTGNLATLRSPKVLLPAGHSISYYWRNTSVNKVAGHDTTFLEVSVNGGATWLAIDTLSPATQNATYVQRIRDLNSYAGNNFFFRFRHVTDNTSGACNVYIDDISIYQNGFVPTLFVTPANQNVTSPAGSTAFTVTSNSAWTASSDQTWCVVNPSGSGNGTITANYTENTSGAQRIAHITVSVAGLSPVVVTVTQGNGTATLSVTPSNQNVASPAGTTNFAITSNTAWTAVSDQTWCTITPSGSGNGSIIANYTENTSGVQRVANITVTAIGLSPVVVTVTQAVSAATLSVAPANQNVSSPAGATSFAVSSNTGWTAVSDQTWCTVTSSGSGNGTIDAIYTENYELVTRIASITVTVAGLTPVVVTVTQEASAPFLYATPANQDVTYQSGTTNFTVNSNTSWSAVSDAGWCAVTPSGNGSSTIFANYAENTVAVSRVAHITISSNGINPTVVTVTQQGPAATLSVMPMVQNVTYQAGMTTFAVTSNTNWTTTSDATWCQLTASGSGSGVISATYGQNETMVTRTANITVNGLGVAPVILQVIQQPSYVSILEVDALGLKIFPNPARDYIRVIIPGLREEAVVQIFNVTGIKVFEQAFTEPDFRIDISSLGKGVFVVKVISENKFSYRNLVIN